MIAVNGHSNVIIFKEEQLEKAPSPMKFTEEGIDICTNDEHPSNALSPMDLTEEGIVNFVKLVQLIKVLLSIDLTEEGNSNCFNELQPPKALLLITLMNWWIWIFERDLHCSNDPSPIVSTEEGMVILESLMQFLKT